jgi:hypothetical protein
MDRPNSTTAPAKRQPSIYPAPFLVQPANLRYGAVCDKARTLLATEVETDRHYVIGLTCKRWGCRPCAQHKIRVLAAKTALAAPNRLLTLTVDPKNYQTPREAFEHTAVYVPELMRALRARFGELEYLRVTEVTRKGFPHYHLLLRSAYIPHPVVQSLWRKYTGATIVDIRQVNKSFRCYLYLCKYLSKMHALEWTERHVSYSRHFFLATQNPKPQTTPLGDFEVREEHPFEWLATHCLGQWIIQTGPLSWFLAEPDPTTRNQPADRF